MAQDPFKTKITRFYRQMKRMPSYSEMMGLFSYKSRNSVTKLVNRLVETGFIAKDRNGKIIPGRSFHEIKLLGEVVAGWPSPAEEEKIDTITIDEYLIRNKEATYMLHVKGDSMKDAGIVDGDIVLVERSRDFKDGDIVVANVDGEFTMKYYRKKGGKPYLEAANSKFKPIFPKESLEIIAVVVAKLRKYKF